MIRLASAAVWLLLFLATAAAFIASLVGDSATTRWLSTLGLVALGSTILAFSRRATFARGLSTLTDQPWNAADESYYRRTAGVFAGPAVTGVLILLLAAVAVVVQLDR